LYADGDGGKNRDLRRRCKADELAPAGVVSLRERCPRSDRPFARKYSETDAN
jgi:hypothetical protein